MGPTGRPYHGFPTPPKLSGHGPDTSVIALSTDDPAPAVWANARLLR